mmetsp:Transcript_25922/g.52059  ORF Transcript_25922/g.52059 Transcript_25922/m.52059 type:complete len:206 (+) Transcript_25922:878-1495(+)
MQRPFHSWCTIDGTTTPAERPSRSVSTGDDSAPTPPMPPPRRPISGKACLCKCRASSIWNSGSTPVNGPKNCPFQWHPNGSGSLKFGFWCCTASSAAALFLGPRGFTTAKRPALPRNASATTFARQVDPAPLPPLPSDDGDKEEAAAASASVSLPGHHRCHRQGSPPPSTPIAGAPSSVLSWSFSCSRTLATLASARLKLEACSL